MFQHLASVLKTGLIISNIANVRLNAIASIHDRGEALLIGITLIVDIAIITAAITRAITAITKVTATVINVIMTIALTAISGATLTTAVTH